MLLPGDSHCLRPSEAPPPQPVQQGRQVRACPQASDHTWQAQREAFPPGSSCRPSGATSHSVPQPGGRDSLDTVGGGLRSSCPFFVKAWAQLQGWRSGTTGKILN